MTEHLIKLEVGNDKDFKFEPTFLYKNNIKFGIVAYFLSGKEPPFRFYLRASSTNNTIGENYLIPISKNDQGWNILNNSDIIWNTNKNFNIENFVISIEDEIWVSKTKGFILIGIKNDDKWDRIITEDYLNEKYPDVYKEMCPNMPNFLKCNDILKINNTDVLSSIETPKINNANASSSIETPKINNTSVLSSLETPKINNTSVSYKNNQEIVDKSSYLFSKNYKTEFSDDTSYLINTKNSPFIQYIIPYNNETFSNNEISNESKNTLSDQGNSLFIFLCLSIILIFFLIKKL